MKVFPKSLFVLSIVRNTRWRGCSRHCAKSQEVAV